MQNVSFNQTAANVQSPLRRARLMVIAGIAQFIVSNIILALAATQDYRTFPAWVGLLDVTLVLTLAVTGMFINRAVQGRITPKIVSLSQQISVYVPVVLIVGLWLWQNTFDFNYLTGVAWRLWILLYYLPGCLAAWGQPQFTTPADKSA